MNYYNMIDWQREKITEPTLTKHLSDEKKRDIIGEKETFGGLLMRSLNGGVHIKLVTEASAKVRGEE